MSVDYSSIADDVFVNLNLQTALPLPDNRETVLNFYEAVQKQFRSMTMLYQRESGEYVLEGDRESGRYQWMEIQSNRLAAGAFNPDDLESAFRFHRWLLQRSVYYLGVGGLDVECIDLMFGFNLDYVGNRDAIVSQALLEGSPLAAMSGEIGADCVEFEPNIVFALEQDCYRQVRLSIETRGSSFQIRTGQYEPEPISVYLTVREHPRPGEVLDFNAAFAQHCQVLEELTSSVVIPNVLQPIASAISTAQ